MEYHRNCGLSKEEWELEKIVDQIKSEPSTLICIGILRKALRIHDVVGRSEQLPPNSITDKEYNDLMKALYPKDNRKR